MQEEKRQGCDPEKEEKDERHRDKRRKREKEGGGQDREQGWREASKGDKWGEMWMEKLKVTQGETHKNMWKRDLQIEGSREGDSQKDS